MGRFFRTGGWLLKRGGGVLKKPVEGLKEFDPPPIDPSPSLSKVHRITYFEAILLCKVFLHNGICITGMAIRG